MYDIKPKTLSYYYKHITSDYAKEMKKPPWESLYDNICKKGLVLRDNIWDKLCIDEKNVWGHLITIISNPKKNKIVSEIPGTESSFIIRKLEAELSDEDRKSVKEVSLDMSSAMEHIVDIIFPNAKKVHDRFHVIRNILEDLTAIRIRTKTKIKKQIFLEEKKAKEQWYKYVHERYANWETLLEVISKAIHQLQKRKSDWNYSQRRRRCILKWLDIFSEICIWYNIYQELQTIYDRKDSIEKSRIELLKWLGNTEKTWEKIDEIWNMNKLIDNHRETILNYFISGHSNWFAEGLNSRIEYMNTMSKWFHDKNFLMYKIAKIFW